jgi:hypothetical protein
MRQTPSSRARNNDCRLAWADLAQDHLDRSRPSAPLIVSEVDPDLLGLPSHQSEGADALRPFATMIERITLQ